MLINMARHKEINHRIRTLLKYSNCLHREIERTLILHSFMFVYCILLRKRKSVIINILFPSKLSVFLILWIFTVYSFRKVCKILSENVHCAGIIRFLLVSGIGNIQPGNPFNKF